MCADNKIFSHSTIAKLKGSPQMPNNPRHHPQPSHTPVRVSKRTASSPPCNTPFAPSRCPRSLSSPLPHHVRDKVIHNGINIPVRRVEGHKMHPWNESIIMPLRIDSHLEWQTRGSEKRSPSSTIGVSVDVGHKLVLVLILH